MAAIIDVFVKPGKFFGSIKEKGMKKAWWYFAVLSLFFNAMLYVSLKTGLVMKDALARLIITEPLFEFMLKFTTPELYLQQYIVGLLLPFIMAAILFGYIHIFGGKGSYAKTFQMYVYARTPVFIFGWLPYLGLLAWFYELALFIVGTVKIHKVSRKKAIWMYVVPMLILLVFALAGLYLFMAMMNFTEMALAAGV